MTRPEHDNRSDTRLSVLLLRNVAEHSSRSMERFPDELARQLRHRGHVGVSETTVRASWLAEHRWTRRLERQAALLLRYPRHVRRQAADVFHVVDHAYAHLARWAPPGQTVVTCHDLMLLHAEREDIGFRGSGPAVWRFRWFTSHLRRAAVVVCDSAATADDVVELVGVAPSRVRVIPLGIGAAFSGAHVEAQREARRRVDPTRTKRIVIHVSTGGPYKNVDTTLRVIDALRSRGIDPLLVRVGAPLADEHRALARQLGLLEAIREFQGIPDSELAALYGAADVLLFPSLWEGFGWPPLEALASGTPSVVAAECRSVVDLVGDAALVAPGRDVAGLTNAVERILTDPGLASQLVGRGGLRIAPLTWDRTAAEYEQVYRTVAERGERR